jgi:hypothetical protein
MAAEALVCFVQTTGGAAYGATGDPYGSGGAGVVDSQGGGLGEHLPPPAPCLFLRDAVESTSVASSAVLLVQQQK